MFVLKWNSIFYSYPQTLIILLITILKLNCTIVVVVGGVHMLITALNSYGDWRDWC